MSTAPANKKHHSCTRMKMLSAALLTWLVPIMTLVGCSKTEQKAEDVTGTPKTVVAEVQWPSREQIDKALLSAVSPDDAIKVAASPVPVLFPSDRNILKVGVVSMDNHSYNFGVSEPLNGIYISVVGNRIGVQYPGLRMDANSTTPVAGVPIRGKYGVTLSKTESGGWDANWTEFGGVDYVMMLRCDSENDARCQSDTYLRELLQSLHYVGGVGQ